MAPLLHSHVVSAVQAWPRVTSTPSLHPPLHSFLSASPMLLHTRCVCGTRLLEDLGAPSAAALLPPVSSQQRWPAVPESHTEQINPAVFLQGRPRSPKALWSVWEMEIIAEWLVPARFLWESESRWRWRRDSTFQSGRGATGTQPAHFPLFFFKKRLQRLLYNQA